MLKRRDAVMLPLAQAIEQAAEAVRTCSTCGNLDTQDPCNVCRDPHRDTQAICVVEEVADMWALERSGAFRGRYHVLGGTLSAFQGIGPQDLSIDALVARAGKPEVSEIILALNATVEGQTTGHFISERLADTDVKVTYLAHGVPMGGELDYLDDGTLTAALRARRAVA
jgi:recombination protein RecR